MTRLYPAVPRVGVLAIVRRGSRFLLVCRGKEPNRGRWGFPGGAQELGETIVATAIRELAEETGLRAGSGYPIDALDAIDRDESGQVRYHYSLIAVLMDTVTGEALAADDAEAVGWFSPEDLASLPVIPAVGPLMRAILLRHP